MLTSLRLYSPINVLPRLRLLASSLPVPLADITSYSITRCSAGASPEYLRGLSRAALDGRPMAPGLTIIAIRMVMRSERWNNTPLFRLLLVAMGIAYEGNVIATRGFALDINSMIFIALMLDLPLAATSPTHITRGVELARGLAQYKIG